MRQVLGLDSYALVTVPGGAQFLTLSKYLSKFAWAGWRWVKFLGRLQKPVRVILIPHNDCRWYQDSRFLALRRPPRERQISDMERVRAALEGRCEGVRVDLYLARLKDGGAVFETI